MGTGAAQPPTGPPEQRLADRLTARQMGAPTSTRATAVAMLGELGQVDLAVYRAIAGSPTPMLDRPMRRLSAAANWSRLWIIVGGAMAVAGGRAGRRAAGAGLVALAVDSAVVNIGLKVAARRSRPDRDSAGVPTVRRVPMPASASFPSGHTASGFAFTNAVAHTLPAAAGPLGLLASAVGYARVHTGVHYPGDVIIGAVVGTAVGEAVGWGARRLPAIPRVPLKVLPAGVVIHHDVRDQRIRPMELFVRAAEVLPSWGTAAPAPASDGCRNPPRGPGAGGGVGVTADRWGRQRSLIGPASGCFGLGHARPAGGQALLGPVRSGGFGAVQQAEGAAVAAVEVDLRAELAGCESADQVP